MNSATVMAVLGSLLLAVLLVLGWYALYRKPRDLNAPHRLGEAMGLRRLNEAGKNTTTWYGGTLAAHDFALTYVNLRYGNYERRRPTLTIEDVVLSLRLAVTVNVAQAPDIVAYFPHGRPHRADQLPQDFAHAFDRRLTSLLSERSRAALLDFAQTTGSLRLRRRSGAPGGLFAQEVLPEAQVVLVHDRRGHKQTPAEIDALLGALLAVAGVLEEDPIYQSVRSSD